MYICILIGSLPCLAACVIFFIIQIGGEGERLCWGKSERAREGGMGVWRRGKRMEGEEGRGQRERGST